MCIHPGLYTFGIYYLCLHLIDGGTRARIPQLCCWSLPLLSGTHWSPDYSEVGLKWGSPSEESEHTLLSRGLPWEAHALSLLCLYRRKSLPRFSGVLGPFSLPGSTLNLEGRRERLSCAATFEFTGWLLLGKILDYFGLRASVWWMTSRQVAQQVLTECQCIEGVCQMCFLSSVVSMYNDQDGWIHPKESSIDFYTGVLSPLSFIICHPVSWDFCLLFYLMSSFFSHGCAAVHLYCLVVCRLDTS